MRTLQTAGEDVEDLEGDEDWLSPTLDELGHRGSPLDFYYRHAHASTSPLPSRSRS